jgi:hypothetical protein
MQFYDDVLIILDLITLNMLGGECKLLTFSSLNVFDYGVVLLRSIFWTFSIDPMFFNHNVSRDG